LLSQSYEATATHGKLNGTESIAHNQGSYHGNGLVDVSGKNIMNRFSNKHINGFMHLYSMHYVDLESKIIIHIAIWTFKMPPGLDILNIVVMALRHPFVQ
jgi:hypothetical protein